MLVVFSLGVGTILRHTAGAITIVLAVVLTPVIAIGFLPEHVAEWFEKYSLMGAGLSIQQTVERPDNIPLGPWGGLAVVTAYAATAFLVALVSIARRDA
jgi:ABC-2 type transport system permease protein